MKKVLILVCLLTTIYSCKKGYVCNCKTTYTNAKTPNSAQAEYINEDKNYAAKMTKKQATSACDHEALAIQSNLDSFSTLNGQQTADPNLQSETTCITK